MIKLLANWRLISAVVVGWVGIAALATYGFGFICGCLWTMMVGGWLLHYIDDRKQW